MKGRRIWNIQRYSAILIFLYILYVAYFLLFQNDIDYWSWTKFLLSYETRILTSLIFIVILMHAFIGLWTVGTDYLTNRTLGFISNFLSDWANFIRKSYQVLFCLLGLVYLASVLYIIWT